MPHSVTFLPAGRSVDVPSGTTLLEAARLARVALASPCNGAGMCGKCRVKLDGAEDAVFACSTDVAADLRVTVPPALGETSLKVLEHGIGISVPLEPSVAGDYGVVVDIGTTTLVASLVDLRSGAERASAASFNPQAHHAQDVLSRITLAARPQGLALLYGTVTNAIGALLDELAQATGVAREEVREIVYSGNTAMLHLATGTDPASLGKHPYTPKLATPARLIAREHRIRIAADGLIYLPPVTSGFVGADITSGMLAARLGEIKGVSLFIDIGTNGEMVLAVDGDLTATSTAAGPAFEGMNVSCGMRAGDGAIEAVEIGDGDEAVLGVIGGVAPRGICGSGLLDAVGAFVARGIVAGSGRFRDGRRTFELAADVAVTQRDIRQVQLAKGAVRSGLDLLLAHAGISYEAVDRVLIAGSFGFHLRPESLFRLGLLPRAFDGRITFLGNTSKTGGQALLLNASCRARMAELVRRVKVLDLATFPQFQRVFIESLQFAERIPAYV